MNSKLKKPFMSDPKINRDVTCPHKDEILEIGKMKETIDSIAETQKDMFDRLFVQNGNNNGKDCLSVQIQKNTTARERVEEMKDDERRNKWRRRGFYAAIIGIFISNMFMILHEFVL